MFQTRESVSSRSAAIRAGWEDGIESCALALWEAFPDDRPSSTNDPGWSDWFNYASESAISLRVPERWRAIYERAFRRGAMSNVRFYLDGVEKG
jgi:hypothetical protein